MDRRRRDGRYGASVALDAAVAAAGYVEDMEEWGMYKWRGGRRGDSSDAVPATTESA